MTTEEVINILAEFNTWRRGLPPYEWNDDPSKQKELQYSAKEIGVAIDEAVDMLRQSAGMIGSEKKYEYGVIPHGVYFVYQTLAEAEHRQAALEQAHAYYPIVRREVGEWEEVENV